MRSWVVAVLVSRMMPEAPVLAVQVTSQWEVAVTV